jgi:hypothetical protein
MEVTSLLPVVELELLSEHPAQLNDILNAISSASNFVPLFITQHPMFI